MAKPKTYFEQVPLAVVKKIVEEEELRNDASNEQRGIEIPPVPKAPRKPNSKV